jgi:hypothetical protein
MHLASSRGLTLSDADRDGGVQAKSKSGTSGAGARSKTIHCHWDPVIAAISWPSEDHPGQVHLGRLDPTCVRIKMKIATNDRGNKDHAKAKVK